MAPFQKRFRRHPSSHLAADGHKRVSALRKCLFDEGLLYQTRGLGGQRSWTPPRLHPRLHPKHLESSMSPHVTPGPSANHRARSIISCQPRWSREAPRVSNSRSGARAFSYQASAHLRGFKPSSLIKLIVRAGSGES